MTGNGLWWTGIGMGKARDAKALAHILIIKCLFIIARFEYPYVGSPNSAPCNLTQDSQLHRFWIPYFKFLIPVAGFLIPC